MPTIHVIRRHGSVKIPVLFISPQMIKKIRKEVEIA